MVARIEEDVTGVGEEELEKKSSISCPILYVLWSRSFSVASRSWR
jgi:hypothetical protein